MTKFDYNASAELFAAHGRSASRLIYYRFPNAAAGIGYAVEELPSKVFLASVLEVDDQRYNAKQIRALYDSETYPLSRKQPSS